MGWLVSLTVFPTVKKKTKQKQKLRHRLGYFFVVNYEQAIFFFFGIADKFRIRLCAAEFRRHTDLHSASICVSVVFFLLLLFLFFCFSLGSFHSDGAFRPDSSKKKTNHVLRTGDQSGVADRRKADLRPGLLFRRLDWRLKERSEVFRRYLDRSRVILWTRTPTRVRVPGTSRLAYNEDRGRFLNSNLCTFTANVYVCLKKKNPDALTISSVEGVCS